MKKSFEYLYLQDFYTIIIGKYTSFVMEKKCKCILIDNFYCTVTDMNSGDR